MRRRIVAASFVTIAVGGLASNSFSLFLVTLPTQFDWSRAEITLAYGIYALTAAISSPFIGWAVTRFDSRLVFAGLAVASAVGLLGCAVMNSLLMYWLCFGLLVGFGSHSASSFALFTVIGSRFSRRAATAMSFADAGAGMSIFLALPVVHWVMTMVGWRWTFVVLAAVMLPFGILLHLTCLPAVRRRETTPATRASRQRVKILGNWPLLLMAASFICGPAAYQGLQTQQIALLTGNGVATDTAVWIASMIGLIVFAWRLVSGWICDRVGPWLMMAISAAAAATSLIALVVLMLTGYQPALVIYPLGLATGFSSQAMLLAIGLRGIVPPAAFPQVFGALRTGFSAGNFIGPTTAALIFDRTGSYGPAVVAVSILAFVHFAGFLLATRRHGRST